MEKYSGRSVQEFFWRNTRSPSHGQVAPLRNQVPVPVQFGGTVCWWWPLHCGGRKSTAGRISWQTWERGRSESETTIGAWSAVKREGRGGSWGMGARGEGRLQVPRDARGADGRGGWRAPSKRDFSLAWRIVQKELCSLLSRHIEMQCLVYDHATLLPSEIQDVLKLTHEQATKNSNGLPLGGRRQPSVKDDCVSSDCG